MWAFVFWELRRALAVSTQAREIAAPGFPAVRVAVTNTANESYLR